MHFVQRRRVKIRIIRKQLPQRRRLGRRGGLISAGIFVIAEIQFLELIALIKGLRPSIDDRRLQPDRAERITVSEGILAEGKRPIFPLDLHRFQSGTFGKSSGINRVQRGGAHLLQAVAAFKRICPDGRNVLQVRVTEVPAIRKRIRSDADAPLELYAGYVIVALKGERTDVGDFMTSDLRGDGNVALPPESADVYVRPFGIYAVVEGIYDAVLHNSGRRFLIRKQLHQNKGNEAQKGNARKNPDRRGILRPLFGDRVFRGVLRGDRLRRIFPRRGADGFPVPDGELAAAHRIRISAVTGRHLLHRKIRAGGVCLQLRTGENFARTRAHGRGNGAAEKGVPVCAVLRQLKGQPVQLFLPVVAEFEKNIPPAPFLRKDIADERNGRKILRAEIFAFGKNFNVLHACPSGAYGFLL